MEDPKQGQLRALEDPFNELGEDQETAVDDREPWEFEEEDEDLQMAFIDQSATVSADVVVD